MQFIVRSTAAALFGLALGPAAFAEQAGRVQSGVPYATATRAPVCTRTELSLGISGSKCGQLDRAELASFKGDRDNTN